MSMMFEESEKKEEKEEDVHKPGGDDEGKGGNMPGFIKEIAANPGKYILYGGLAAALIFLFTKVRTSHKNRVGVRI